MAYTFNLLRAMAMTYLHAKFQGQRTVISKDRVETNRRMDKGECTTCHANAVGKNHGKNHVPTLSLTADYYSSYDCNRPNQ